MQQRPIVTITMEHGPQITLELYPEEAPNTVNSFLFLAQKGCFDRHSIERIVPGFVVDVSYRAFSRDACKYLIDNESKHYGHPNSLRMEPGVIAMGGYGEDGIAGGEFFFPLEYHARIDGYYPVFGKIRSGLDEILRWQSLPLRYLPYPENPDIVINEPVTPLVIESVRAETFGISYPEPIRRPMKRKPPSW